MIMTVTTIPVSYVPVECRYSRLVAIQSSDERTGVKVKGEKLVLFETVPLRTTPIRKYYPMSSEMFSRHSNTTTIDKSDDGVVTVAVVIVRMKCPRLTDIAATHIPVYSRSIARLRYQQSRAPTLRR